MFILNPLGIYDPQYATCVLGYSFVFPAIAELYTIMGVYCIKLSVVERSDFENVNTPVA